MAMRSKKRIAKFVVFGLLMLAAGGGAVFWWALHQEPDFYGAAVEVERSSQVDSSREMSSRVTMLYSDARNNDQWHALFTTEQINAWLAVDLEEKHPELLPPEVSDPRVQLSASAVTLAARYDTPRLETVLSLSFDVVMIEPNRIGFRIFYARAGAVPVTLRDVMEAVEQGARGAGLQVHWTELEGDPVAVLTLRGKPDEKGRAAVLEQCELRDGQIYFAGRTVSVEERVASSQPSPASPANSARQ